MNRLSRILHSDEYFFFRCACGVMSLVVLATHIPTEEFSGQDLWFPGLDEINDGMIVRSILYAMLTLLLVLAWTEQANIRRHLVRQWTCSFGNKGLFIGPMTIAAVFSIMNEVTRPFVSQTCSFLDFFASMIGIVFGFFACVAFIRWPQPSLVTVQEHLVTVQEQSSQSRKRVPVAPRLGTIPPRRRKNIRREESSDQPGITTGTDNADTDNADTDNADTDNADTDKGLEQNGGPKKKPQVTRPSAFRIRIKLPNAGSASEFEESSLVAPVVQEFE
jgi:hypothetical protein